MAQLAYEGDQGPEIAYRIERFSRRTRLYPARSTEEHPRPLALHSDGYRAMNDREVIKVMIHF